MLYMSYPVPSSPHVWELYSLIPFHPPHMSGRKLPPLRLHGPGNQGRERLSSLPRALS